MFGLPREMRLLRGQRVGRRLGGMAGFLSEHSGQSERADAIPGLSQKASSMHHGSHPILVDVDKFIEIHEDPCQALQSFVGLCEREQCFFFHGIRPSGQRDLEGVLQALVRVVSALALQARRKVRRLFLYQLAIVHFQGLQWGH